MCVFVGVLGIKVKIMRPFDVTGKTGPKKPLPDVISISEPKEEEVPSQPWSEQKVSLLVFQQQQNRIYKWIRANSDPGDNSVRCKNGHFFGHLTLTPNPKPAKTDCFGAELSPGSEFSPTSI